MELASRMEFKTLTLVVRLGKPPFQLPHPTVMLQALISQSSLLWELALKFKLHFESASVSYYPIDLKIF